MATNRTRRTRQRASIQLDESIETFYLTGTCERDTAGWRLKCSRFFDNWKEITETWAAHREFLLKKWKAEGREKSWIEGTLDNE
jgi:hypothetical protein